MVGSNALHEQEVSAIGLHGDIATLSSSCGAYSSMPLDICFCISHKVRHCLGNWLASRECNVVA